MEHPTGFQSSPAECFPKGVTCEAPLSCFGYIGWKPGRKFRSRIRMDGSAVYTRDTTPRTKMGLSVDPHLCPVWLTSLLSVLIACFLSNISLRLIWHWRGYPISPTKGHFNHYLRLFNASIVVILREIVDIYFSVLYLPFLFIYDLGMCA